MRALHFRNLFLPIVANLRGRSLTRSRGQSASLTQRLALTAAAGTLGVTGLLSGVGGGPAVTTPAAAPPPPDTFRAVTNLMVSTEDITIACRLLKRALG